MYGLSIATPCPHGFPTFATCGLLHCLRRSDAETALRQRPVRQAVIAYVLECTALHGGDASTTACHPSATVTS